MGEVLGPAVTDRRFLTARSVVVGACAVLVTLFVLAVPARYAQVLAPRGPAVGHRCRRAACQPRGVGNVGAFYSGYQLALQVAFALVCVGLAFLMLRRPSARGMTLVVGLVLVLLGTTFWNTIGALATYDPGWGRVGETLGALSKVSLFVLLFVFPDGRFVPGVDPLPRRCRARRCRARARARRVARAWPAAGRCPCSCCSCSRSSPSVSTRRCTAIGTCPGPDERLQTKWVVTGLVAAVAVFLVVVVVGEVITSWAEVGTPGELVAMTLVTLGAAP